jgi:4-hydroxy-3-polyprenylbenzoate decarboxylase
MSHANDDFAAPIASGSFRLDGTIVVPCSNETVGSLASGTASNLIHKAGSIALQEDWPLILVTQESPLSLVALRSLATLKEAGATILPACPSFAANPRTPEDMADTVLAVILRALKL